MIARKTSRLKECCFHTADKDLCPQGRQKAPQLSSPSSGNKGPICTYTRQKLNPWVWTTSHRAPATPASDATHSQASLYLQASECVVFLYLGQRVDHATRFCTWGQSVEPTAQSFCTWGKVEPATMILYSVHSVRRHIVGGPAAMFLYSVHFGPRTLRSRSPATMILYSVQFVRWHSVGNPQRCFCTQYTLGPGP